MKGVSLTLLNLLVRLAAGAGPLEGVAATLALLILLTPP